MSNPFINTQSNTETSIKVNSITQNAFGNIIVPVSSCPDVRITTPTNGQQLTYSSTLNQWHSTTPSSKTTSLYALTYCSITGPLTNIFTI